MNLCKLVHIVLCQCRGGAPKKPGAVRIECVASTDQVSANVTTTTLSFAYEGVAEQLRPFILQGSSNVSGMVNFHLILG